MSPDTRGPRGGLGPVTGGAATRGTSRLLRTVPPAPSHAAPGASGSPPAGPSSSAVPRTVPRASAAPPAPLPSSAATLRATPPSPAAPRAQRLLHRPRPSAPPPSRSPAELRRSPLCPAVWWWGGPSPTATSPPPAPPPPAPAGPSCAPSLPAASRLLCRHRAAARKRARSPRDTPRFFLLPLARGLMSNPWAARAGHGRPAARRGPARLCAVTAARCHRRRAAPARRLCPPPLSPQVLQGQMLMSWLYCG